MAFYITIFRIILVFPTAYFLYKEYNLLAFVLILIGALSDWLDGSVARTNKEENNLGALLDPFADKVFVLVLLSILLYMQEISPIAYILLLLRELFISFLRSLAVEKGVVMKASYMGKAKTFFEFVALLLLSLNFPLGGFVLWLAVLLAYASAYDYVVRYAKFTD